MLNMCTTIGVISSECVVKGIGIGIGIVLYCLLFEIAKVGAME